MATIVTRAGKGSPLTNTEVDANFTNLNNDKQEVLAEGSFADGDKIKLDGIESGADVTDTANVTAAGALMDSELTNIVAVKALNQGVATTDSPTFNMGLFTSGIIQNSATISNSYSISSGNNAISAGPITIGESGSITIPDESSWTILGV